MAGEGWGEKRRGREIETERKRERVVFFFRSSLSFRHKLLQLAKGKKKDILSDLSCLLLNHLHLDLASSDIKFCFTSVR